MIEANPILGRSETGEAPTATVIFPHGNPSTLLTLAIPQKVTV
jgi:hypothetical protein